MPSAQTVSWARMRIIFVGLVALAILGVLVYLLSGGTIFQAQGHLYTYVPDATGIDTASPVRFDGIQIGKVSGVELSGSSDPNRIIRVDMKLDLASLRLLTEDATTDIASEQLPGYKYIDVNQGKSSRRAASGGTLEYKGSPDLMKTLDLTQFETRLRIVQQMLSDIEEGRGPLGRFVATGDMYRDLTSRIEQMERGLRVAVTSTTALGQALYTDEAYQGVLQSIRNIDAKLAQLQANKLLRSSEDYDNLRNRLADIHRTIADLNAGKGGAGAFLQRDDMYAQWNRKLTSFIASVDNFNAGGSGAGQMFTSGQVYESLTGAARELQSSVKDFREDPQKFLRLKVF